MDKILETLNEILNILKSNGSLMDKAKVVLGAIVKNKSLTIVLIALVAILFVIKACSGTPSNGEKMINVGQIEFEVPYLGDEPEVNPTIFVGYSNNHRKWLQKRNFSESIEFVPGSIKFSWEKLDTDGANAQVRSFVTLRVKLNKRLVLSDVEYLKQHSVYDTDIYDPATIAQDFIKNFRLEVIDTNGEPIQEMSLTDLDRIWTVENGLPHISENLDGVYDFFHFLTTAEIGDEYDWVVCTGCHLLNSISMPVTIPGIKDILAQVTGIRISWAERHTSRIFGLDYEGENIWNYDEEEAAIEQLKKDIKARERAEQDRKIRDFLRGR